MLYFNVTSFVVLLMLLNKVYNHSFILQGLNENSELRFTNFLKQFQSFHIIFHTDSTSLNYVNSVVKYLNGRNSSSLIFTSIQIFNHDNNNDISRSQSIRILNVLMSDRSQFWTKTISNLKTTYNDVVIFMSRSKNIIKKVKKQGYSILKYAGNTLIIQLNENNSNHRIYRSCFYCGNQSRQFTLISTMKNNEVIIDSKLLLPNDFKNLNGHLMNIIYMQYYPYVYCINQEIVNEVVNGKNIIVCKNLGGIESKLVETLSEKLNFNYLVQTLDENGSFFDMIMYVYNKNADIAFGGVSITEDRIPYIQFTNQYNLEDYVFLYLMKHTFAEIFEKFSEPFRATLVWFLYIVSFFASAVSVYICTKVGNHVRNSTNTLSLGYVIWILLHTPFEQSTPGLRNFKTNMGCIITMTHWWGLTIIMITLYKSSVLSAMVHPPNVEPDDLEQLIARGFRVAGNIHYQDVVKELLDVNDTVYRHALHQAVYGNGPCATFTLTLNGGVAMLDEMSEIQYELRAICPNYYPGMVNDFRITKKSVRSTGHGWALQKGAPYQQAINSYLSLILSGGLYTKWINDETAKAASKLFRKSREITSYDAKMLSFTRFKPLLIIYIAGICLASICFIIEIIIYFFQQRNKIKICNIFYKRLTYKT